MRDYKYKIFTSAIEENINKGILKPGDWLPSVRNIKQEFSLSTSSVQSGYDYLVFKGLIISLPRRGYKVAHISKADEQHPVPTPVPRDPVFHENITLTSDNDRHTEFTPLNTAAPSDLFVPQKLLLNTMQKVIREKGAALLRYYPANGSEQLRNLLSRRSARHGAMINPDEIIITDGALQALYIALAATTEPGDIVAIESPCVFSVLEVIANLRLKTIEIPVGYKNGFDIDYLENTCKKNNIKAIVLTPNFHNPTGILISDGRKKETLMIADQYNIPIIENDIYGDLHFGNSRPSNIKNFDTTGNVITYSSFSKSLAPGIRLGWMSAGRFFPKAERVKFSLGRSVSPFSQEVISQLLNSSSYDKHLRSFRFQLEQQALALINTFNQYLTDSYTPIPQGGYSIWSRLPAKVDMKEFYNYCEKYRLHFTPGKTFSFTNIYDHHFRSIFSQRITDSDLQSIQKIGALLSN
ncbi:PLP-dependent aminotransferase family protein [Elizabethkingia sp. HX WHF]|uniref:aminotransferase-like domain-containing protein n=1 Tax=Elizabethkingia TaxID=308865 RepID=UPI000999FA50|nr:MULTISPECIES: PLP-dependent aminotransferase family protein [Elizabethkingia]ATL45346.1 PLP-dependent aminotransferase family protein [Elizabethkingia miricola]MCL1636386.1 PLP-dependent aminotransferase family protein [Elizabethkingia bruuniana]MDX8562433.1 PLP-dependent aminotransferase family protein [Elizabethkingia sp. HX WHF]OPC21636.1 GntR family transcriptional regulator [Elizabethkingia bruuniana]